MKTLNIFKNKFSDAEKRFPLIRCIIALIAVPVTTVGAVSAFAALFAVPMYILGLL